MDTGSPPYTTERYGCQSDPSRFWEPQVNQHTDGAPPLAVWFIWFGTVGKGNAFPSQLGISPEGSVNANTAGCCWYRITFGCVLFSHRKTRLFFSLWQKLGGATDTADPIVVLWPADLWPRWPTRLYCWLLCVSIFSSICLLLLLLFLYPSVHQQHPPTPPPPCRMRMVLLKVSSC